MKVGDLVQLLRKPVVKGLPVGIIIKTTYSGGGEIWCDILWSDGLQCGAWDTELMEMEIA